MVRCVGTLNDHLLFIMIQKYLPLIKGASLRLTGLHSVTSPNKAGLRCRQMMLGIQMRILIQCFPFLAAVLTLIVQIDPKLPKDDEGACGNLEFVNCLPGNVRWGIIRALGHHICEVVRDFRRL